MRPEDVHLAVVGTGPIGLEAAAWAKHRGYQVTIFERQAAIGGDWLRWGNPWSKLQSHRDSYLFSGPVTVPEEDRLPSYPTRDQILNYFRSYADVSDISKHMLFNTNVTGRSAVKSNRKLDVFFIDKDGTYTSLEVTHVFAAPGRVNKRREIRFNGEVDFRGHIAWGTGQDLSDYNFLDKNVVIVGHGSFAIENARYALEQGSQSVLMLARHDQVIMSRAAGFFVDRSVDRNLPTTIVAEFLRNAYRLIDYNHSALESLFFGPCRAMFPTSDFYFLARASGKLKVVIDRVAKLTETSVETASGLAIPADVLIKCTGFTHDTAFDKDMKSDLKKGGRVTVSHNSDGTFTMNRNSSFSGISGGFRHVSPCYQFITTVEGLPYCDLAASNNLLRARVACRSRTKESVEDFLAEQQSEWAEYCSLLGVSIDYPYSLEDMRNWDALLENLEPLLDWRGQNGTAFNELP